MTLLILRLKTPVWATILFPQFCSQHLIRFSIYVAATLLFVVGMAAETFSQVPSLQTDTEPTASKQVRIQGHVFDSLTHSPLAYVNIGIKNKAKGTVSLPNGSFALLLSEQNQGDTLVFSLVGYQLKEIPIQSISLANTLTIQLNQRIIALQEVKVFAEKLVEKKYGTKTRNRLIHFTDGMFINSPQESYEIGQVIRLGNRSARITSVNLHINDFRADSASLRINFYRYQENNPAERLLEKSIIQRHAVKPGWLRLDLTAHQIDLKGDFVAAIEFLPEVQKQVKPISYEVKLGGTSRSFFRRNSLGKWNRPPHHYCLYVTALVDKHARQDPDQEQTLADFTLFSATVQDTFSLFVHLPRHYSKQTASRHPVVYLLDGNAYFDPIRQTITERMQKKKFKIEPILIGIGYRDAYLMDSLRVRDYTFPQALPVDSLPVSGGAQQFYQFLKQELIPYIDRHYRTDTTSRTLMGHSFGGYFTLYALLQQCQLNENSNSTKTLFTSYVAASPSITYGQDYLLKQFSQLSLPKQSPRLLTLYVTAGELELREDHQGQFTQFIQRLESLPFIRLQTNIYPDTEHMGTAIPSLEQGVELGWK